MTRALPSHGRGRWFKSSRAHHLLLLFQRSTAVSHRPYPVEHPHWHTPGTVREQKWPLYRRRNGRYHVQIRKNGYPSVTKTFIHLKTAKKWASGVEADMERQRYCPIPETILLGGLLYRYEREVLPNSSKSHQVEHYRLKQLNQHFSSLKLS